MFYKKMIILAVFMLSMDFAAFGMGYYYAKPSVDTRKTPQLPKPPIKLQSGPAEMKGTRSPRAALLGGYSKQPTSASYVTPTTLQIPNKRAAQETVPPAQTQLPSPMEPSAWEQLKTAFTAAINRSKTKAKAEAQVRAAQALTEEEIAFNKYLRTYQPSRGEAVKREIAKRGAWDSGEGFEESVQQRQRALARRSFDKLRAELKKEKEAERDYMERLDKQYETDMQKQALAQRAKQFGQGLLEGAQGLYQQYVGNKPQAPVPSQEIQALPAVEKNLNVPLGDIGKAVEAQYLNEHWGWFSPERAQYTRTEMMEKARAAGAAAQAKYDAAQNAPQAIPQEPAWRQRLREWSDQRFSPNLAPAY